MQIQKLRPEELTKLVGKPGTLYYTDIDGVVTHYLWNAGAFNPAAGFTSAQVPALQAVVSGDWNGEAGPNLDTVRITASSGIKSGAGRLVAVRCETGTSIAIVVYDNNAAASGRQIYSGTLSAGGSAIVDAIALNGMQATISGGAVEFVLAAE